MFNIGDKLTKENYTQGAIWCNKNNAKIVQNGNQYIIEAIPEHIPTYEEVQQTRANLYAQEVDPLMAEYTRKKTFNLFEEGEEAELLAKVEAVVAWIKESNPYPEVEEIGQEPSVSAENEEENAVEEIGTDQVSDQVSEQVND